MNPQGWKTMPIRELLAEDTPGFWGDPPTGNGDTNVLRCTNLLDDGRLDYGDVAVRSFTANKLASKLLVRGDILLERSGGGPDQPVGRVGYFDRDEVFSFSNFMQRIRANENLCLGKFLFYQLWGIHAAGRTAAMQHATTGIRNLDFSEYLSSRVFVPPFSEQAKIVEILECWDRAYVCSEKLLSFKVEQKRGLMQKVLFGKSRFSAFKNDRWRMVRIGNVLEPQNRYEQWDDSRLYRLAGVRRNGNGLFFRDELPGTKIKVKLCKKICAGDFLISRRQMTYGGMAIVPPEFDGFDVNDEYEVLVVRKDAEFDMRFFGYLSETAELKYAAYVASNGFFAERLRLNLDLDQFLSHRIALPASPTEMQKIVGLLDAATGEIELLQKQLDALKEQKRGLMQKMLPGEVREKL
jgi:type I restriction enzyme S subunit